MSEEVVTADAMAFGAAEAMNGTTRQRINKEYEKWAGAHRDEEIDKVVRKLQNLKPPTDRFTDDQLTKLGKVVPTTGEAVNEALKGEIADLVKARDACMAREADLQDKLLKSMNAEEIRRMKDEVETLAAEKSKLGDRLSEALNSLAAAQASNRMASPTSQGAADAKGGGFGSFTPSMAQADPGDAKGGGFGSFTPSMAQPDPGDAEPAVSEEILAYRKRLGDGPMERGVDADKVPRGMYLFDHTKKTLTFGGKTLHINDAAVDDLTMADERFTAVIDAIEDLKFTVDDDGNISFDFTDSIAGRMFVLTENEKQIQGDRNTLMTISNDMKSVDKAKVRKLVPLLKKGVMYDEMMNNGLLYDNTYVGGFYDRDYEPETGTGRLGTALKLLWVVLTSTAGKMKLASSEDARIKNELVKMRDDVMGRLGKLGLTETRNGQILQDLKANIDEMIAAAMGDFSLVGVKDYKGVPEEAKEDGGTLFSLTVSDELIQKKIINAITSFLMTARGEEESPYASIAEIAWQFHKVRAHVITALMKVSKGDEHKTDHDPKGALPFSAGEFNEIMSRIASKYL